FLVAPKFNQKLRILDVASELTFLALERERLGAPNTGEIVFIDSFSLGRRWPEGPDEGRSFALTRRFAAPSPGGRGTRSPNVIGTGLVLSIVIAVISWLPLSCVRYICSRRVVLAHTRVSLEPGILSPAQ